MLEVYTSANQSVFWMVKAYLEENGIECEATNTVLGSIAGEIPMDQAWPRLMVVNDRQIELAKEYVQGFLSTINSSDLPSFCPECDSEDVELISKEGKTIKPTYRCNSCSHQWKK